jgi:hypothetical protein
MYSALDASVGVLSHDNTDRRDESKISLSAGYCRMVSSHQSAGNRMPYASNSFNSGAVQYENDF